MLRGGLAKTHHSTDASAPLVWTCGLSRGLWIVAKGDGVCGRCWSKPRGPCSGGKFDLLSRDEEEGQVGDKGGS